LYAEAQCVCVQAWRNTDASRPLAIRVETSCAADENPNRSDYNALSRDDTA